MLSVNRLVHSNCATKRAIPSLISSIIGEGDIASIAQKFDGENFDELAYMKFQ